MSDAVEDVVEEVETEENETHNAIVEAFDAAVTEEKDEDSTKMAMIQAGATFKNVTRLYNQFMIDAGLAISKADRNELVDETLEGKDFSDEEGFDSAVVGLVEAIKGTTERSAGALIRAYAKKNDLEVFAKPKSTGEARHTWRSSFYDFLVGNPSCTSDEAKAFINGEGDHESTTENVKKSMSTLMAIHALANRIAAK